MLKNFYLYLQQIGEHRDLVLQTDHDEFTNFTMCSSGLEGLAEDLVCRINVNWGASYTGKVDIYSHPSELMTKHLQVVGFPISELDRKKFERFLPKRISVNWVEEIKTK